MNISAYALATARPYLSGLEDLRSDNPAEARLLRMPALNFEALWLHYSGTADEDKIIPLRSFHDFTAFEPVPLRDGDG
ncbi:MAG TPA: hypothetical protein VN326_19260 [Casimicrobiaceae bacterium]|jgi:hypothetical protein|nr:hypothetical protein [Casimicrobiaceae bacterium]